MSVKLPVAWRVPEDDSERLRLWAWFLFLYALPDRERTKEYFAELWRVFDEHYPRPEGK